MYMDELMKEMKICMGRMGVKFLEEERGWRLVRSESDYGTFC